ncbi:HlyC/CorC family transporter [Oceanobacillus piezotolerans]|uniref:HlyC/CorC family transporter n=2 Tax=Oceanobacillus piezotolerans TaxID=2448030 RepID=A0A498DAE9_9BACI|nr:HlyC/CorC family transporter [Oceanobacillus piezotolerans]
MLVAILILLTAFFVATEFSIVKVRSTRIDQLIAEGNKRAISAKKLIDNLDAYLSACQLGITVTALGIGWLGESTVERLLHPVFQWLNINGAAASFLSFLIAFGLITFLHVVVGELAPKTIAIQKAEQVTLILARPLMLFYRLLYPFIWLLNGSAQLLVRLLGFKPMKEHEGAHSEEEVRMILSDSYKNGEINLSEMMYVNNIFTFDERIVRDIMTPRTEMVCFYKEDSFKENMDVIRTEQYTRYPVADEDKDHIIGLVNLKEVFTGQLEDDKPATIEQFIRPILHVAEATPIRQVLLKMQREQIHMAIVNDEYGGTAGLLTVEDILEEIVGDIRDEFDDNEIPLIEEVNDSTKVVSGKLLLEELREILETDIPDEEVDTIGGWVFSKNLDAKVGTAVDFGGYQFIIDEMDGYQIKKVKIVRS